MLLVEIFQEEAFELYKQFDSCLDDKDFDAAHDYLCRAIKLQQQAVAIYPCDYVGMLAEILEKWIANLQTLRDIIKLENELKLPTEQAHNNLIGQQSDFNEGDKLVEALSAKMYALNGSGNEEPPQTSALASGGFFARIRNGFQRACMVVVDKFKQPMLIQTYIDFAERHSILNSTTLTKLSLQTQQKEQTKF